MTSGATNVFPLSSRLLYGTGAARGSWRQRWQEARDVVFGVLVLAAWLATWTVTWAAVAGPLSPAHHDGAASVAAARE